jgi:hypothetical protein
MHIPVLIACKNAKVRKPKLMESYTYGAGPLEIDGGQVGMEYNERLCLLRYKRLWNIMKWYNRLMHLGCMNLQKFANWAECFWEFFFF